MRSLLRRRPSAATLIALLALFVALGGPAQASRFIDGTFLEKGSVTSRQVKDHTLRVRDLNRKAVRSLRRTPNGSITEAKLSNGAVTPGKLARGAVGSSAIADRSVRAGDIGLGAVGGLEVADDSLTGADIADGRIDARDFARFWGHFTSPIGPVAARHCWHGDPVGLAPERSGASISGDVILVTPAPGYPDESLTFFAHASTTPSRFTLSACNPTAANVAARDVTFNYVILHVP
jgi:hypothetical protein